jgi:hypothetical protein
MSAQLRCRTSRRASNLPPTPPGPSTVTPRASRYHTETERLTASSGRSGRTEWNANKGTELKLNEVKTVQVEDNDDDSDDSEYVTTNEKAPKDGGYRILPIDQRL